MADVSAVPFINFGESQARQGQAQAAAALQAQQAQGAAMQNQIQAARMPFIMKMYEQMAANSDASGIDGQFQPGGPLKAKQDSIDEHGFDAEQISAQNRSTYTVPEWLPDEQRNNLTAQAAGEDAQKYYAMQRQQRKDIQGQRSAVAASNRYDIYATASTSPSAYRALKQSDPRYTTWLDQQARANPDAYPDQAAKENAARGYAKYQAADIHQYTNRPLEFKENRAVDAKNGLPVLGVPDLPMSPKDRAQFVIEAQKPTIEIQTGIPGQTRKMSPAQVAGMSTVDYLAAVTQGLAPSPEEINARLAGKPNTANDLANFRSEYKQKVLTQAAQGQHDVPYMPAHHAAPDPSDPGAPVQMPPPRKKTAAPAAAAAAAAPPPAAAAPPPAAAAPPATAPTRFTGRETLDNVPPGSVPRYKPPQNTFGTGASTQQGLDIAAQNKEKFAQMENSGQQLQKNATERGLMDQADVEIQRLRRDPRATGPGSYLTTAWNEFRAYATGKSPDPLVERKMLDKVLLQLGAANVSLATAQQGRVGQQEYMKLLTEGNPTGTMPLDAIQKLINMNRYNNEFDTRLQNTKIRELRGNADPYSAEFNDLGQGRAAYVQARMNPNGAPGTGPSGQRKPLSSFERKPQ